MTTLIIAIFLSIFGQDLPTTNDRPGFDPGSSRDGETEIIIEDEYGG